MEIRILIPSGGLVKKLIFTRLINIVPVEQGHHKPMGMYCGGLLCDGNSASRGPIYTKKKRIV